MFCSDVFSAKREMVRAVVCLNAWQPNGVTYGLQVWTTTSAVMQGEYAGCQYDVSPFVIQTVIPIVVDRRR